jgi:N-acyl amino acid synthase of PEP-CTERM/exosortase system
MSLSARFSCARPTRTAINGGRSFDLLRRYLTVVEANSTELLDDVFRLRFQVYCLERGFEDAAEYPDGRERDHDDSRSAHFLVFYRGTGSPLATAAGTVRFIMPRPGIELPVLGLLSAEERRLVDLPLDSTAEVSRFAVAKAFRRRLENELFGNSIRSGTVEGPFGQRLPLLTFGLLRAVVMMSIHGGITHIVAMMEPALLRLLARLGVEFNAIGKPVEHHGERQPVWATMTSLVERVKRRCPELWDFATDAGRELPAQKALVSAGQMTTRGTACRAAPRAERLASYGY